jgi:hypothetical protein
MDITDHCLRQASGHECRNDVEARAQGVESVLEVWDEMVRSWHFYYPHLQEGREAIAKLGAFIRGKTA